MDLQLVAAKASRPGVSSRNLNAILPAVALIWSILLGVLSNPDDDGDNNVPNLHI